MRLFYLWGAAFLLVATIILSLVVKTRIITMGYEIAMLQTAVLEEENRLGTLNLTLQHLSSPVAVEAMAKKLGMVYPDVDKLEFLHQGTVKGAADLARSQH